MYVHQAMFAHSRADQSGRGGIPPHALIESKSGRRKMRRIHPHSALNEEPTKRHVIVNTWFQPSRGR